MEQTPFGRYRLLDLLGRGGMGEVWRAHDTETDRVVALKVLPAHLAQDAVFQERFRREAQVAARLNEPHVVPIHNYGEIDGRLYVDMRLIEGRDLQSVLADGPLDPGRAVTIVDQVAKALHAAHKAGLVHRDVKPSNILVTDDDFAYLIDFGIARSTDEVGLTGTGAMIGTLHYMAPERLSDGHVDARSDTYALACVLHECLTGCRPFPGDSAAHQISGHLMSRPPRPSTTRPGVPASFDEVIAIGMAKEPDQRYASTVELVRAARDAITNPLPRSAPTVPRPSLHGGFGPNPNQATQFRQMPHRPSYAAKPANTARNVAIGLAAVVIVAVIATTVAVSQTLSSSGSESSASRPGVLPNNPGIAAPPGVSFPPPIISVSDRPPPGPPPVSANALNVSVPMTRPACDGMGIVVLGSAVTPGRYAEDIQRFLDAHPGSQYLRTDESCPSLRQRSDAGNPIYAVYRPAGYTQAEVCAAVRAAGGDAYGRWLDLTTDPAYLIHC